MGTMHNPDCVISISTESIFNLRLISSFHIFLQGIIMITITELTMSVSLFHIYVYDGSVFYKIVIGGKERVEEKEQDNRSKVQALISISTV